MAAASSIKWAAAPFDKETADIILRSSDDIHYRVRRGILAEASTVFDDMFANALPATSAALNTGDEMIDGVPVIAMAESGKVLEYLLSMYYPPFQGVRLEPTEDSLLAALDVARKYFMDYACQDLMDQFTTFAGEGYATRLYALTCKLRWIDDMLVAAKASLKQPLQYETILNLKRMNTCEYEPCRTT